MKVYEETIGTQIYVPLTQRERIALKTIKRNGRIIGVFVADAIREKLAREEAKAQLDEVEAFR